MTGQRYVILVRTMYVRIAMDASVLLVRVLASRRFRGRESVMLAVPNYVKSAVYVDMKSIRDISVRTRRKSAMTDRDRSCLVTLVWVGVFLGIFAGWVYKLVA